MDNNYTNEYLVRKMSKSILKSYLINSVLDRRMIVGVV